MKKATKGALAAAAAGSLLLGGAGSLAYWTSTGTVTGGTIKSGKLALSAPVCNGSADAATHDWQYSGSNAAFTMGTSKLVPGDTITKVCKMTLTLEGDHIGATLAFATPVITDDASSVTTLDSDLTKDVAFTVDDAPYVPGAAITTVADHTILATVTVALPYGSAAVNSSQATSAILQSLTLTATQTANP